ncbi:lipopolysaccharide biosynthesis protein [Variovorax sp. CY25R-8]|uniref:lipopolysaccharide biosynthesis protein n=1 Tax=Variovorax sp. CY25R-8 TaxID=2855501 RepID=UPI0021BB4C72|nr:lipopolysaccharide biosynthesis protein [Variovorax sp. CY25R-8]MCT8175249.1 lipopolysaccharide biosynthesis protein [Variovorax sp. CY25R-8]
MKIKNAIGFAVGPFAVAFFSLLTVPIVAWVFSPEDVGRLNIFQVTISFLLLFCSLGLDQAFVREYHENEEKNLLFKNCAIPGFFLLLAAFPLGLVFERQITFNLYNSEHIGFYLLTFAAAIVSYCSRFLSLILRMQERGLAYSMSQAMPKAFLLVLLGLLASLPISKNFLELLWAYFLSMAFVLLIYIWNTRSQLRVTFETKLSGVEVRKLLKFGLPLVVSGVAYWAVNAASTFMLHGFSDLEQLAIYSVAVSFAGVAVLVQSIFSVIWTPLAFKWQAEGVDMKRVDVVSQQVLALICIALVFCGAFVWIADYLLPPIYASVKYLIVCSVIQPLLYTLSIVTSVGIGIARKNMLSVLATVTALIANLGTGFLLIPKWGAPGAAIANAFAFYIMFIMNTEASARVWRNFPRFRIYVVTGVAVLLSILTCAFASSLPFSFSILWALTIPFAIWLFKSELISIWALFRNKQHGLVRS